MKNSLYYSFPEVIYLFITIPIILILFFQLNRYRTNKKKIFGNSQFFNSLHYERPQNIFWRKTFYLTISTSLVIFSLMDPKGNARYFEEINPNLSPQKKQVYLFLDTSKSMNVKDIRSGKTRLLFAKEIGEELIGQLKGENVSLYTFTSEVNQQTPLTLDYLFTRMVLHSIEINHEGHGGTDFVELARTITNILSKQQDAAFFIFSDGGDLDYETGSQETKEKRKVELKNILKNNASKMQIFTIGLGTEDGGKVPETNYKGSPVTSKLIPDLLQLLSMETNSHYYFANSYGAKDLGKELVSKLKTPSSPPSINENQKKQNLIFDYYFQRPLALAILLLAAFIIVPDNWKKDNKK